MLTGLVNITSVTVCECVSDRTEVTPSLLHSAAEYLDGFPQLTGCASGQREGQEGE